MKNGEDPEICIRLAQLAVADYQEQEIIDPRFWEWLDESVFQTGFHGRLGRAVFNLVCIPKQTESVPLDDEDCERLMRAGELRFFSPSTNDSRKFCQEYTLLNSTCPYAKLPQKLILSSKIW